MYNEALAGSSARPLPRQLIGGVGDAMQILLVSGSTRSGSTLVTISFVLCPISLI
jgi:hypothetical protein